MKKIAMLAVVLVAGLAFVANATEYKSSTKVTGDTTKTVVKGPDGKLVETVVDKPGETTTKTVLKGKEGKITDKVVEKPGQTTEVSEIKGKNADIKRTVTETQDHLAGTTTVKIKDGTFKDLNVDWSYEKRATDYVLNYTVKDHKNPDLIKELGLTPEQAKNLTPGTHQVVSTSPYTGMDAVKEFRSWIAKDLKKNLNK